MTDDKTTTGGTTQVFGTTLRTLESKYSTDKDDLYQLAITNKDGWKDYFFIALRSLNDYATAIHEQDFSVKNDFGLDRSFESGSTLCERIDEHFIYSEKVQDNPITAYHHLSLIEHLLNKAGRGENESGLEIAKVFLEKTNALHMNLTSASITEFVSHGMGKIANYRALPENPDKEAAWQDVVMYFGVRTREAGDQMLKLAGEDYCKNRDTMKDLLQQNKEYDLVAVGNNAVVNKQKKKTRFWRVATVAGLALGGLAVGGTYAIMQNASGNTESSESVSGVYEKMIGCAPQEKIIGEQDKTITEQANTILNMQEEKEENNGSVPQSITEQTAKAKESEGLYTTCETQKTALQTKYNTDTAGYSVLKQDNARLIQEQDKLQQDYIALSNNSSTLVATIRENIDNKAIVVNLAADYIRNAGGSVHVDGLTCSKKSAGIYNLWIEGSHPNSFSTEEEQKITKHLRYFCKPGKFKCSQIIVK